MSNGSSDDNRISHAIFDLDGTLVNTVQLGVEAIIDTFSSYQTTLPDHFLCNLLRFRKPEDVLSAASLDLHFKCNDEEEFLTRFTQKWQDGIAERCCLLRGVLKVVQDLKSRGIALAIATGSSRSHYDFVAKTHPDFFNMFDHVVCGRHNPQVMRNKPFSDIYEVCVRQFHTAPRHHRNVLVFEDSFDAVTTLIESGFTCVMVSTGQYSPVNPKAHLLIENLEKFDTNVFNLPEVSNGK